jgi:hypothetical protein
LRVVVVVEPEGQLLEVVLALEPRGGLADLLHGREEQADQDRDDRDDNEQFNQCEPELFGTGPWHGNDLRREPTSPHPDDVTGVPNDNA